MKDDPPEARTTFVALYEQAYADVVRFAQRRAGPDHGEDVAEDTFLVAWRRLDEVPAAADDARAWLFGIARHVMLNRRRGDQRREALAVRVAHEAAVPRGPDDDADLVARRVDLARAWRLLSPTHQEALALAVLDGVDAPHAAQVLGISPVAYRLRLSRARRALRAHLGHLPATGAPARAPERTSTR
ncbi:RNA polymerase sigma factor [Cellulomonas fimi]|uniref:RNA polymerase, sigma-24 subunit, ECF subfamily n=1 Tax=Cellulomonas fimi (strain ATCC 484 / DSM 20113 / JCM 1341 / CCUG 24087 / LMG 16345 / NBRC 15513 / NCIMB 8980 / NCTC 7547 / NRS-133) TaxID=590998 RepID=F4H5F4_CELFA|nr:sigma-70 family RNA polymerase sigma factor [Cellulomonas fimi]AEE47877.1 RNA polymerase, sigma-24 subunit, ECF subfamily [Cellulomonas fimi ATCC 484]NNH05986.1 sigma-70 family RNA polymerase sigma factor [Cellulomonas fimi]VEH37052.1 RNA polymerase sigma factor CnrH [Cellulomonas fimi]